MRVFVTGATGFIGLPVVKELIAAGHSVLGLARSDTGAATLRAAGADVQRGSLQELDSLRAGAAAADAVIHLAFIHDFSRFAENCQIDKLAIETIGAVLSGTAKPLLVTGGLAGAGAPGRLSNEEDPIPSDFPFPRVSEQTALALPGVKAGVVRLPQVHDTAKQGLVSYIIPIAREKGVSAYIDDGSARWAAVHVSDAARLYRLALGQFVPGRRYHAVAQEGVSMKDIAQAIGQGLKVPLQSVPAAEAAGHFGVFANFAAHSLVASSTLTQQRLGWTPTGPNLIQDLLKMDYS